MKTSCAYNRCLQIFFIIVQILFIFVGCVLIGLGAWFEILDQNFEAIVDGDQLVYGAYLTIAAGCAIIVLSVIGIFGAICDYKANRVLLFVYIVLVIVVFILQSIGGILAFTYREDVVDLVRDGLNDTMPEFGEDTNRGESITDAWDFVQENLDCCGINNYTDWADDPNVNSYPASCCSNDPVVNASSNLPPCSLTNVYQDGCEDALTTFIRDNLLVVASVAITFVVAEVIVVLMAICLLCCTDFD
jgi:hypothetical protein